MRDSHLVRMFLLDVCKDDGDSFRLVRLQTFYRNNFSILSDREIFGVSVAACGCQRGAKLRAQGKVLGDIEWCEF